MAEPRGHRFDLVDLAIIVWGPFQLLLPIAIGMFLVAATVEFSRALYAAHPALALAPFAVLFVGVYLLGWWELVLYRRRTGR